jgi:hypothetical protein
MSSLLRACALFFSLAVAATSARAQELAPPFEREAKPPERVLDGHVVLSPTFFPTAFLSTHFSFRQGITQVMVPDYPVTENTRIDADLLGLDERIEAGFRFAKILELSIFGYGQVLSGSNAESVVTAGSSFSYGGGLTGRVRLLRSEASGTQISARVLGSAGKGGSIELIRLADYLLDNSGVTLDSVAQLNVGRLILGSSSRRDVSGQLLAAQTLGPHFDVQGYLGVGYSQVDFQLYNPQTNVEADRDLTTVDPEAGIALGANLTPVPIGFLLEYVVSSRRRALAGSEDGEWSDFSHLIGLGVHSVHPNFQVGLTVARQMATERVSRIASQGQSLTSGRPSVHYAVLEFEVAW